MEFFWVGLVIFGFLAILGLILPIIITSDKQRGMRENLETLTDFNPTQMYIGDDGETGIAVDEERKSICLIKNESGHVSSRNIGYRDVLSSELFVDGETVTKTARGSQIGGALIGGIALGGVGAIIGGLSGATRSATNTKRIDLRVTVNDTKHPNHDINFMRVETETGSGPYNLSMNQARHWHGLIAVLIKQADSEDAKEITKRESGTVATASSISVADELSKLSNLRDRGLLTEEEFLVQKRKLLL